MLSKLCGRIFRDQIAASPFERLVAFGYEDGPVSGIVRCSGCDESYRFELLATDIDGVHDSDSWDRGEELRIFALAPLPDGAFDRIVTLLAAVEAPSWPIWAPGMKSQSARLNKVLSNNVAAIVRGVDNWRLAVVTSGLLQPFIAVQDMPPVDDPAALDWFALFGFVEKERILAPS